MKRRSMKKWIPKGQYCGKCKYRKKIVKLNKTFYKCEYLKLIDIEEETLLWDKCKECNIKDY